MGMIWTPGSSDPEYLSKYCEDLLHLKLSRLQKSLALSTKNAIKQRTEY